MSDINICRLCLEPICKENVVSIESIINTLEVLSLNLNCEITKDPVVCPECTAILQNYSDFKSASVDNVDAKLSCFSKDDGSCRFCLQITENGCLIDPNQQKEYLAIAEMLSKHIPGLNLSITEALIMCENCLNFLKIMCNFILNCINVENQIKKYVELKGFDDNGYIDLNYLQKTEPTECYEISSDNLEENLTCKALKSTKIEDFLEVDLKYEGLNINLEQSHSSSYLDVTVNQSESETNCSPQQTEHENSLEMAYTQQKFRCVVPFAQLFECGLCCYTTKEYHLFKKHMTLHINLPLGHYKCHVCDYSDGSMAKLRQHLRIHPEDSRTPQVYKCEKCGYEKIYKCVAPTHNCGSIIDCKFCPFQTRSLGDLRKHLRSSHPKRTSLKCREPRLYICDTCAYKTKVKDHLILHMVKHRDSSRATMFKCNICTFETKYKSSLNKHKATGSHRNVHKGS